jgi:hypothetical protein
MYRELAAASPDRYRPDLAYSLNRLAALLAVLGRPTERRRSERRLLQADRRLPCQRRRHIPASRRARPMRPEMS